MHENTFEYFHKGSSAPSWACLRAPMHSPSPFVVIHPEIWYALILRYPQKVECRVDIDGDDDVCTDPPHFIVRPRPFYQRRLMQTVHMPCVARGDPTPTVSWRRVSVPPHTHTHTHTGTLCLSHYVTEISYLYSLRDFWRHFGLCRAAAHSDCCFLRRVQIFLLTYLLTYSLKLYHIFKKSFWLDD